MIRFSPFDLKIYIRVVGFLLLWKFFSLDYSAIALLNEGPNLYKIQPGFLNNFIDWLSGFLFSGATQIRIFQVCAGAIFLCGLLWFNKAVLALGMVLIYLLDLTAFQFRSQIYDIDFPLAVLTLVVLYPLSWKKIKPGNPEPDAEATQAGLILATYIGCCYLLFGLSKLDYGVDWIENVRLDRLRAAMIVWHGTLFPWYLEPIAGFMENFFFEHRTLEWFAAAMTLVFEVLWITSLFNKTCRWVFPVCMYGSHIIIFLGSGISFFPLATVAVAVLIPWRNLFLRNHAIKETPFRFPLTHKPWLASLSGVLLLAFLPALLKVHLYPFANNLQFGWSYKNAVHETEVYRLGYFDPERGEYEFLPMNHGGFMDFRHLQGVGKEIRRYVTADTPSRKKLYKDRILQYRNAIRPLESNRWLLGPLASPPHLVSAPKKIPAEYLADIYMLKTTFHYAKYRERVIWEPIEKLDAAPPPFAVPNSVASPPSP